MDRVHPGHPHFPAEEQHIWELAAIFRHGETLNNDLCYIKAAHDIQRIKFNWSDNVISRISRGANKITIRKEKPRIRRSHHLKLVAIARSENDLTSFSFMAIARTWLTRVQSELIPLQRDGIATSVGGEQDTSWHSCVDLSHPTAVSITWRRRKDTDRVTTHIRP